MHIRYDPEANAAYICDLDQILSLTGQAMMVRDNCSIKQIAPLRGADLPAANPRLGDLRFQI